MLNDGRILIVAAHPDDETIGAAIRISRSNPRQFTIVHVTDGAPRNVPDREAYAHARREELHAALSLAGVSPERCQQFGFVDQEAYLHLPELIARLERLIEASQPSEIYTHPYEGGHPDHDACAFAVAQAARKQSANHREFTSYHAGPCGMIIGEFLEPGPPVEVCALDRSAAQLKQQMYRCFRTQQHVLQYFPIVPEKFRDAPRYDFTEAPHPGILHYETLGWNITGNVWRARAVEVLGLHLTHTDA